MKYSPDTDDDLEISTRQQLLGEEWWTSAFLAVMRPGRDTTELVKGRRLAERGQVVISGFFPGGVDAIVLGAVGGSRKVSLWLNDLEDDWEVVFRIFASQQVLFSRLIAGDYPEELHDMLAEAGIPVIPTTLMDLDYRCDCESNSHTCSHIVATYLALGKYINDDPMKLFLLRGKSKEEIISGVTRYLSEHNDEDETESSVISDETPDTGDPPVPDRYYTPGPEFETIRYRTGYPPGEEDRVFRLLGPSPFRLGKTNLADLIGTSYPKAVRYLNRLNREEDTTKKEE